MVARRGRVVAKVSVFGDVEEGHFGRWIGGELEKPQDLVDCDNRELSPEGGNVDGRRVAVLLEEIIKEEAQKSFAENRPYAASVKDNPRRVAQRCVREDALFKALQNAAGKLQVEWHLDKVLVEGVQEGLQLGVVIDNSRLYGLLLLVIALLRLLRG